MSNGNQQPSAACWPTGVPRADIEGLCKQLDYTFVDIPDLVDSDDDEVEMAEAPTNPQCEASSRFAPLQQPWPGTAVWPPTTAAAAASTLPAFAPPPQRSPAQAAGAAAHSSWAASHHGHLLSSGMVPPGFGPQPQHLGAAIPGPSSGAPTATPPAQAAASYNANNAVSGPGIFAQQQQHQQQQQQQPLLPPGVAWGPEHLRRLQQQPLLVQPAAYTATQPAGRPGNSPAGS